MNRDLAAECLSEMTIDIDWLLTLNIIGRDTSEDDLIRLVAVWIDADKDARLGRLENLLQHVSLDTIPHERFALIFDWEHAIIDCRQSR